MNRVFCLIVVLFIVLTANSQEYLIDVATKVKDTEQATKRVTENLTLPIFDDFSYESNAPNPEIWQNSGVYVNYTYPIGPPTVGVATFDAVNNTGDVYETLSTNPSIADSMRTHPFTLDSEKINSTYVTFYYQPQGHGNAPEEDDKLVLRAIAQDVDSIIWEANGIDIDSFLNTYKSIDTTLNFKLVHINLDNPNIYGKEVQLQFENYVSIAGDHLQSGKTNADHWNIDYFQVRDDVTAADTIFEDVALVKPFDFFMKKYSTVPWSHYEDVIGQELVKSENYIRNLYNESVNIPLIRLYVTNLETHKLDTFSGGIDETIPAHSMVEGASWVSDVKPVTYDGKNSASFKFVSKIFLSLGADHKPNNEVVRYFDFENYYARDDGSAEKAYGLDVNGAQVAYHYKTYKEDTLTAINIRFEKDQDLDNSIEKKFKLCVWSKGSGDQPGTLLRLQEGASPEFHDEFGTFATFKLDEPIVLDDEFFIGWEQTTEDLLNVGFDANTRSNNSRLFYKVYNNWYKSDYNGLGALMIRPVFGSLNATTVEESHAIKKIDIYPNPSNGLINIESNGGYEGSVEIYNSLGAMVYKGRLNERSINLNNNVSGTYLVRIVSENRIPEIHRVIITK